MRLRLQPTTLTVFGKGAPGSVGLSFAPSASAHCSKRCPHYGRGCYAENLEKRYRALADKLARHHSQGFAATCRAAQEELRAGERAGFTPIWFRLCVCGSVPARPTRDDVRALRELCGWLVERSIPIHFPTETRQKATRYRRALRGLGVVVRESATSAQRFKQASGPSSFVVAGTMADARNAARKRRKATGRRCIVCPAVAAKKVGADAERAKCGNCTACATPTTDVVYPKH